MTPLKITRKLDSTGRIVIPKQLRIKYGFKDGGEYPYFFHEDGYGGKFLCIKCPGPSEEEIEAAKMTLETSGYTVIEDE